MYRVQWRFLTVVVAYNKLPLSSSNRDHGINGFNSVCGDHLQDYENNPWSFPFEWHSERALVYHLAIKRLAKCMKTLPNIPSPTSYRAISPVLFTYRLIYHIRFSNSTIPTLSSSKFRTMALTPVFSNYTNSPA
jgi:hypothetical protein